MCILHTLTGRFYMKKAYVSIAMLLIVGLSNGACDRSNEAPAASSSEPQATSYGSQAVATSAAPATDFVWRPTKDPGFGSDVANREAFGMVDGDERTLYFQATNEAGSALYSLCSVDVSTGVMEKLTNDCYGMINVLGNYVFYRGYENKGVFRYDVTKDSVKQLYSGEVENLLTAQRHVYFIDGAYRLCQIGVDGGRVTVAAEGLLPDYLQESEGSLYFALSTSNGVRCEIRKIVVGAPEDVVSVCELDGQPMDWLGTQVLFGDSAGVHLKDVKNGAQTDVFLKGNGATLAAANGNGVFYTTTDADGFTELWVMDLERERTINLMPVHCTAVYFIGGEIYLADPVNLGFERVILDGDDPHTEWVIERGAAAR